MTCLKRLGHSTCWLQVEGSGHMIFLTLFLPIIVRVDRDRLVLIVVSRSHYQLNPLLEDILAGQLYLCLKATGLHILVGCL